MHASITPAREVAAWAPPPPPRNAQTEVTARLRRKPATDLLADWLVAYGEGFDPAPLADAVARVYLRETTPTPFASLLGPSLSNVKPQPEVV